MDRITEPSITPAEWAPLHRKLLQRFPEIWANSNPSDVPDILSRFGEEAVAFPARSDEHEPIRATLRDTIRLLRFYLRNDGSDLWPILRAIACLGPAGKDLHLPILMLGTGHDGRTGVELAHAFARIGVTKGGSIQELLSMYLTARVTETRRAAREALRQLGPSETTAILDDLASFPGLLRAVADSWEAGAEDSTVFEAARTSLCALIEADEVVLDARSAQSHRPPMELDEEAFLDALGGIESPLERLPAPKFPSRSEGARAARLSAAGWLLSEGVPL